MAETLTAEELAGRTGATSQQVAEWQALRLLDATDGGRFDADSVERIRVIRFPLDHGITADDGSLLIQDGIPVKVVSERLGHAHIVHHADLPVPASRHAAGRSDLDRAARPTCSPDRIRLGEDRRKPRRKSA